MCFPQRKSCMPNFNTKKPPNEHLVNTLGNPLADEADWLRANDELGDYKPKDSSCAAGQKIKEGMRKHAGEVVVLVAMGAGLFGLFNLTQPSHLKNVTQPVPALAPVAPHAVPVPEVDFGPYMATLQKKIKHQWSPPKGEESKRVVVFFSIDKMGTLSRLKIDRGSGIGNADKAALKAVEDATPFDPLPEGAPASVDIQFTFDYNVFSKDRGSKLNKIEEDDVPPFSS